MVILKQSIGIDVSKDNLDVLFKEQSDLHVKIKGSKKFSNTSEGFKQLLEWCSKREKCDNVVYVLEATGVYHEELLYFLYEDGKHACLELPARIKYFAKSKGIKTKNDKVDSGVIADYGIERKLRFWQPPSKEFKSLRDLSREHNTLASSLAIAKNRLHAAKHTYDKEPGVISRYNDQILFYKKQMKEVEKDMNSILDKDKELAAKLNNITSIKGIGLVTAVKIIAETGGFYLFTNINQLVSYAGLDVIENQSGKHSSKTRISKKGNENLRKALYMPAISAIRFCNKMKDFNERIMQTHQYKKQGIVAVMRKLLILAYTLWRKNESYNENNLWVKA